MEENYKQIDWIDFLKLLMGSCLLLYLGYTYAITNMLMIVVPVPMILIGYKYGYTYLTGAIVGLTAFAFLVINDIQVSGFTLIIVGVNSAALCFFMKERDYTYKILFLGTFVCTASIILFGPFMEIVLGIDVLSMIEENLLTALENNTTSLTANDEPMSQEQIDLMLTMIPFMIVYLSAIFVTANYYLARRYLVNQGFTPYSIQAIEEFRLPDNILIGTTIVLILVMITGSIGIVDSDILSQNAIYIFVCVFMFQGLAVVGHILVKRGVKSPMKTILLIATFLLIGPLFLGLLGWIDSIIDIRKMKPRNRE